MRPSQVSSKLVNIAKRLENSKNPSRGLVASELKELIRKMASTGKFAIINDDSLETVLVNASSEEDAKQKYIDHLKSVGEMSGEPGEEEFIENEISIVPIEVEI